MIDDLGFIDAVVDRWRDATTSTPRPRLSVVDSDAGKAGWMDTAQYVPDPADFR